jgi:hypothetical protein
VIEPWMLTKTVLRIQLGKIGVSNALQMVASHFQALSDKEMISF